MSQDWWMNKANSSYYICICTHRRIVFGNGSNKILSFVMICNWIASADWNKPIQEGKHYL